jgi:S-adenosylmethionine:diacylglycerol 3-amino-3-carboxypropyl transferase
MRSARIRHARQDKDHVPFMLAIGTSATSMGTATPFAPPANDAQRRHFPDMIALEGKSNIAMVHTQIIQPVIHANAR